MSNWQSSEGDAASVTVDFAELRVALAGDRHRPLYHFLAPGNWMNDPNGPIFWKGKYHLFYQYNPNGPFWGSIHWGHAVSSDLVHWDDLPVALTPSKKGPDRNGCWSGCVVDDNGTPTALYTGLEPQTVCIATGDHELRNWRQHETPVISQPPAGLNLTGFPSITGHPSADFRDPFVWREGERWLMIIGAGLREDGGTALLYDSADLRDWRYRHPILKGLIGADCNMWECPILLRFGDRCILLVCPHPEAKYVYWIAGEWREGTPREHKRGKLDLGTYVYAPQCLSESARDRNLVWTWIKEGRSTEAQSSAGWSGLLSLPKECSLDENENLTIKPATELSSLRRECRAVTGQKLIPASANPFLGFKSDCLEIEAELSFVEPTICYLCLRASPNHTEQTTIRYNSAEQVITVDCSQSSLDSNVDHNIVSGNLGPDRQNRVCFRAFLDRSVLELFTANTACITQRLYPKRDDSVQMSFGVTSGSVIVHRLSAWKLAPIWPDRTHEDGATAESAG
jgi:beta-fructofuranosidase